MSRPVIIVSRTPMASLYDREQRCDIYVFEPNEYARKLAGSMPSYMMLKVFYHSAAISSSATPERVEVKILNWLPGEDAYVTPNFERTISSLHCLTIHPIFANWRDGTSMSRFAIDPISLKEAVLPRLRQYMPGDDGLQSRYYDSVLSIMTYQKSQHEIEAELMQKRHKSYEDKWASW